MKSDLKKLFKDSTPEAAAAQFALAEDALTAGDKRIGMSAARNLLLRGFGRPKTKAAYRPSAKKQAALDARLKAWQVELHDPARMLTKLKLILNAKLMAEPTPALVDAVPSDAFEQPTIPAHPVEVLPPSPVARVAAPCLCRHEKQEHSGGLACQVPYCRCAVFSDMADDDRDAIPGLLPARHFFPPKGSGGIN